MRRLPETVAIVAQFPWGRLEKDGSFNYEVARARFNVLGQDRCGYWSCRSWPLSVAHSSVEVETIISGSATGPQAQTIRERLSRFDYLDGKVLLKTAHLSDTDGWKLKAHLIPLRDFASVPERTPVIVTDFAGGVVDWDTWYRWRKLSKLSPAALLMHFVMSTFWLLTRSLGVTRVDSGAKDKRVSLTIHYLGAEIELNFIPLSVAVYPLRRAILTTSTDSRSSRFSCLITTSRSSSLGAARTSLAKRQRSIPAPSQRRPRPPLLFSRTAHPRPAAPEASQPSSAPQPPSGRPLRA